MGEEKKSPKSGTVVIILVAVLLLLAGAVPVYLLIRDSLPAEEISVSEGKWASSEGETSSLNVGDAQIPISFDPVARSADGENFTCAIGNPAGARYDLYLDMRSDGSLKEQVYLSGLLKPGQGITRFKTSKVFPKGDTDIVLVFTTVADDHKTLIAQSMMVLTLSVE